MPSAAPTNVRVVYTDSSSIMVEWDLVPPGSENGVIQGYKVKYREDSEVSEMRWQTIYYFSAVLQGKDDTSYIICVAAFTSKGDGTFSEPINARTKKCKCWS